MCKETFSTVCKEAYQVLVIDDQIGLPGELQDMFRLKYDQLPFELHFESCLTGNNRFWPFKAIETIRKHPNLSLVLLDIKFGSEDDRLGLEILKRIREDSPKLPVVMLTSLEGEPSVVVNALQLGAKDYVIKDPSPESLMEIVTRHARVDVRQWEIIGESKPIVNLRKQIERAAQYGNTTILIQGERGSGKELVARNIWRLGPRAKQPFVEVNCAAIALELFEAEMFGAQRGAYTGNDKDRFGFLELADRGVLFLDEIGEMPQEQQAKLLRALEQKSFRRIGVSKEIKSDFQLISATNADLGAMVDAGTFRGDLYDRIRAIEIKTLPLRECESDIPQFIRHFSALITAREEAFVSLCATFCPEAIFCMRRYPWPGNVRELRQVVEHAIFQANGKAVRVADLREEIREYFTDTSKVAQGEISRPDYFQDLSDYSAESLSVLLLNIIQAVFDKHQGNRAATMRTLFPGLKESYFGRMAWDLVKMNPGLLDESLPEGKRFARFGELKQAYLNTYQNREKSRLGNSL